MTQETTDGMRQAEAARLDLPACDRPAALDGDLLDRIHAAILSVDRSAADTLIADLRAEGASPDSLIDAYIPQAARDLGAWWCADALSFAEVTIATARLQSWLRELMPREDPFAAVALDTPEILVVVPEGTHHTLGAIVAMAQFRRLGAAVQLSLGQSVDAIGARVRHHRFDMVALSAGGSEKLEFLKSVVNIVRTGVAPVPWVLVGGPILGVIDDVGVRIGADAATERPEEALALCGLITPNSDAHGATRRQATSDTTVPVL